MDIIFSSLAIYILFNSEINDLIIPWISKLNIKLMKYYDYLRNNLLVKDNNSSLKDNINKLELEQYNNMKLYDLVLQELLNLEIIQRPLTPTLSEASFTIDEKLRLLEETIDPIMKCGPSDRKQSHDWTIVSDISSFGDSTTSSIFSNHIDFTIEEVESKL